MKLVHIVAIGAAAALVATTAYGQTSQCLPGEGKIVEYDFPLHYASGLPSLDTISPARTASVTCAPGQPAKTTFRGVPGELKDARGASKAIEGALYLIEAGVTDAAAITALIGRVQALQKEIASRAVPTKEGGAFVDLFSGGQNKK